MPSLEYYVTIVEGELHRKPKLSVFCALSIILYIFFEKLCNYLRGELFDKLKNGIRIFRRASGSWVTDQNI